MPRSSTKCNRLFFRPVATLSGFNDRPLINKVVLERECPKYLQQEAGLTNENRGTVSPLR